MNENSKEASREEKDELVRIFTKLPQYLREKMLDILHLSEIFAEAQEQQTA